MREFEMQSLKDRCQEVSWKRGSNGEAIGVRRGGVRLAVVSKYDCDGKIVGKDVPNVGYL